MKPKFHYVAWDLGSGHDLTTVLFGKERIELGYSSDDRNYADRLVKVIKRTYNECYKDGQKKKLEDEG